MIDNNTKICSICKERKPLTKFPNCATSKDSKQYQCTECFRLYYQEHRGVLLEYRRKYYQEHRSELLLKNREYARQHGKENYFKNREEHVKRSREKRQRLKLETLTHYSGNKTPQCAYCGIDDIDILCIDHINNNGNKQRRAIGGIKGTGFYWWLRRNNYPLGYQILCANCNMKKEGLNLRNHSIFGG